LKLLADEEAKDMSPPEPKRAETRAFDLGISGGTNLKN
jgi:hypothetical protein